ncbi:MAG: TAXI family TRAP transporter solute-binding subunit, partial [Alphaproteobacteria bacterium]|nr:TAXI family TRAP transporter solute-binding subunit [Alphaproteobacteria bacterium]
MSRYRRPLKFAPGHILWFAALALVLTAGSAVAQRRFFLIATGPSGGSDFSVAEVIAAVISHPPGLRRCEVVGACGPEGLIASARTSSDAVTNLLDVDAGRVNSALAPANIVAEAMAGTGAFRKSGRLRDIRVIADLFPEVVHLVALKSAHITSVSALVHKTVSVGDAHSDTHAVALSVLRAWRIPSRRLHERFMSYAASAKALRQGRIDAFFYVGTAPAGLITDLLASGKAVLVPIEGKPPLP